MYNPQIKYFCNTIIIELQKKSLPRVAWQTLNKHEDIKRESIKRKPFLLSPIDYFQFTYSLILTFI